MKKENQDERVDAEKFAQLLKESQKDSRLYERLSIALQAYIDGLKTALRCQQT